MYRSAIQSGILDKMTFVKNGVDHIRRNATMNIDKSNNGGSFVAMGAGKIIDKPQCKFVTLSRNSFMLMPFLISTNS
jgi:hypothetical protein